MRQLEEQIRNLVEESVMRKRRRLDPQAVVFPAATNTPAGRMTSVLATGPQKRVRKTQPHGASTVARTKKPAAKEVHPPIPVAPVAAPVAPVPAPYPGYQSDEEDRSEAAGSPPGLPPHQRQPD